LKKKEPTLSRAELSALAKNSHFAVCEFLKIPEILSLLKEQLGDSKELTLLKLMVKSKSPFEVKNKEIRLGEDHFVSKSTVSGAAKRLDDVLRKFSNQFQVLSKEEIVITIPRKKGGAQVGYYFACFDTNLTRYINPEETKKLLEKTSQRLKQKKEPFIQPQFRYLRHIEQVLRIGMAEEPKWLRKTGPIAADFDDGRVYRREKTLNDLQKLLMSNSVSMLEGLGATGKTVLVLNLAYDLFKEGKKQVFYFDCDKDRDFGKHELISEIKSVEGIFILENLHLAPEKFQAVYAELKYNKQRHVLFTTRPSFREFQYSRSEDLEQIKVLKVEPFDEIDAIIRNFNSHEETSVINAKTSEQIKNVCSGSFWLLSYALEGHINSDGKSEL